MNKPEKLIYFEVVQNTEDDYASYGIFESLDEAIAHLPIDDPANIEMITEVHEVIDLKNPCNTCKRGNNKTVLRCRECEYPYWKNHEPRDLFKEDEEYGRWIPVSERLPKDYVPVMISTNYSVFPEARYSKKYGWQWAYSVKRVIVNGPATIVLWEDGTKTVAKCLPEDKFDFEKGIAICFMKKATKDSCVKIFEKAREDNLKKLQGELEKLNKELEKKKCSENTEGTPT